MLSLILYASRPTSWTILHNILKSHYLDKQTVQEFLMEIWSEKCLKKFVLNEKKEETKREAV